MSEIEDSGVHTKAEGTEMGSEEGDLPGDISGTQVVRLLRFILCSTSEKCISCQNARTTEMRNK